MRSNGSTRIISPGKTCKALVVSILVPQERLWVDDLPASADIKDPGRHALELPNGNAAALSQPVKNSGCEDIPGRAAQSPWLLPPGNAGSTRFQWRKRLRGEPQRRRALGRGGADAVRGSGYARARRHCGRSVMNLDRSALQDSFGWRVGYHTHECIMIRAGYHELQHRTAGRRA